MTTLKETPTQSTERFEAELTGNEQEGTHPTESEKTIDLGYGSLTYRLTGNVNPDHNPVIWFSGHEQDLLNPQDAARILAVDGDRQVLTLGQFVYKDGFPAKDKRNPGLALDAQAKAYLAAAEDAGLIGPDKVVDAVSHSFGSLVMARAKELAAEQGINSFEQEKGAHLAILGGSAMRSRDNAALIAGRWAGRYLPKSIADSKALDPTGEKGPAIIKNFFADTNKGIGEIGAMRKARMDFDKLGEALVVIYPEDKMFPENSQALRYRQRGLINRAMSAEFPLTFVTPINSAEIPYNGLRLYLNKLNPNPLSKSRQRYAKSYRGAGHNDPTDNPPRTVQVLLDYFDEGRTLERAKLSQRAAPSRKVRMVL